MNSLILVTASRFLITLLLLFSVFLLLRGHQSVGGGFSGGLVAAGGWALYALAYGPEEAKRGLSVPPSALIGGGVGIAALSGIVAAFVGDPFLTGQWVKVNLSQKHVLDLGTPLLFEVGIYLVVVGGTTGVILQFEKKEEES